MAGKKYSEDVDGFMATVEHPFKAEIEELRKIIKAASPKIQERVKWNAPSYYYKEYDLGAFTLFKKQFVQLVLVFPKGIVDDSAGIMEGDYKDRRIVYFASMDDVKTKKDALQKIVQDWVELIEKET